MFVYVKNTIAFILGKKLKRGRIENRGPQKLSTSIDQPFFCNNQNTLRPKITRHL